MNKHPRGKSGLAVLSLVKNFAEAVPAGAFCVVSHTERASGDECCRGGLHRMLHIQTGGFSTTSAQTKHAQFSIMEHRKTSKV